MTARQQHLQQAAQQAPEPSPVGPAYSGLESRLVGYVPRVVRSFVVEAGGITQLASHLLWSALRHPRGYWQSVREDMYWTVRTTWLPIAVALFGFLAGISLIASMFGDIVGAKEVGQQLLFLYNSRQFVVWVDAIVVAGVIGARLTTDIGTRKVREELDAMEVMGIDPRRDIGVPRVVSLILLTTLISIPSLLVTIVSMLAVSTFATHIRVADFFSTVFNQVYPIDLIVTLINCSMMGVMIGAVCVYKGFTATGGAIGLGRAVNQAVVICFVGIFILQLAFNAVYLGINPDWGTAR